jgi:hypothetical protein
MTLPTAGAGAVSTSSLYALTTIQPIVPVVSSSGYAPASASLYSTSTSSLSSLNLLERQSAIAAIQSMKSLRENWDGYGAASIPAHISNTAATFVSSLAAHIPTPEVSANSNGTISLEWENERGRAHLEIGITKYSLYFRRPQGIPLYRDGFVNELDHSKKKLIGAMYSLAPAQDYTISHIRLAEAA